VLRLGLDGVDGNATVLCLGAHCDDIEIGCGATLARLAREYPRLRFEWAVFAGEERRQRESQAAADSLLGSCAHAVTFHAFRESYLPSQYADVKDAFEALKSRVSPQLVFTHWLQDRHQDHRVLAELTWNTFRSPLVLEYEIPKFEGDLGQPNLFVPVSAADFDAKVDTLMRCFPSQHARSWFRPETFRALGHIRGIECVAPSGYAEAFHARKIRV
jgi:LmbE family N-acetylglucosaminyl deacetylase